MRTKTVVGTLAAAILLTVFVIIYRTCNPEDFAWFPQCMFYRMTGWQCPSCGFQRVVHSLLNGEIRRAYEYNPFLFYAMPFVIGVVYAQFFTTRFAMWLRKYLWHRYTLYAYLAAYCAWGVIRNLS